MTDFGHRPVYIGETQTNHKRTTKMMKSILIAAAAACVLAGCAEAPTNGGQQLSREDREAPTGSMLPRRHKTGNAQVINKDQIDPNQILNPGATQPHIKP
jgi:hypothetical protein